jgi:polygalacturonase
MKCLAAFLVMMSVSMAQASSDVRSFGAVGDGTTKDTAAFQKAIDECATNGGEAVVPAGNYLIGSIELKSNTTLRFEKDAKIIGSPDLDDYPLTKGRWEGRWVDAHRALISAQDAKNIAIVGPGMIAGDPTIGGRQMPRRPCVIETIHCTDVRFEDFSATQARMWTIHPTWCENVTAKNLNIRTSTGNGDGIDVDSCKHVTIDHCDIDTGDDCVALKSGRGMEGFKEAKPTEDVEITNCTLGDSIFACIGIGSETSGGIRNIRISHCTFTHANTAAIYIKSNIDRGAFVEDITANDLSVQDAKRGFLRINLTGSGIKDPYPVPGEQGIPSSKNYSFRDVTVTRCGQLVEASNVPPEKPLNGLVIENVKGDCEKGMTIVNVTNAQLKNINVTGFSGPLLSTANVSGSGLDGAVEYHPSTRP